MKLFIFLLFLITTSHALEWESGKNKVNFIELFTSESCSSCPPAEAWLNKLKHSDGLFKSFVPIEFHVDYWNYLNWKDRFSKPEFTQRQRNYAHYRSQNSVFTPQLLINSSTDWHYSKDIPSKSTISAPNLKVKFNKDTYTAKVNIESKTNSEYICEAALLGGDYTTKVKAGENEGKVLKHEFVAIDLKSTKSKNNFCEIKLNKHSDLKNIAIAIWIKKVGDLKVIQATGNYIN